MIDFSRFNSLIQLTSYFNSEDKCRRYICDSRWEKDDIVCPFCGQHHFVTKRYLDSHIDEAVFRFNTKEMKEADRFSYMFEKAIGCVKYRDVKIAA